MQKVYLIPVNILICLSVLLFCVSRKPRAQQRKRSSAKTNVSSNAPESRFTVALVYRNDISQFVEIVTRFKKTALYDFIDLGFEHGNQESKNEVIKKLEALLPHGVLFTGPESWNIWKSMKKKPRNSIAVVVDPTITSPNVIPLGATPEKILEFLKIAYPYLAKVHLIAKDNGGSFSQLFFQNAEKASIKSDFIQLTSSPELVAKLANRVFSPGEAIVLGPDVEYMTYPLIEALVLLEKRLSIPVIGFSRRHVELGLVAAYQKTPEQIADKADNMMESLLKKSKSAEKPLKESFAGWWYNPVAASHLRVSKNLTKKARPVLSAQKALPPER